MTSRRSGRRLIFTSADAWSGGVYEVAMELMEPSDALTLVEARSALWKTPGLEGCYQFDTKEPGDQELLDPASSVVSPDATLRGVVHEFMTPLPCLSSVVVEPESSTWLYFGIPMGSLSNAFPSEGYPMVHGDSSWRKQIDEWLVTVARRVHDAAPLSVALVGWITIPVSGREISEDGIPELSTRHEGYLVRRANELVWHPPNYSAD